jgi:hypothetical protein
LLDFFFKLLPFIRWGRKHSSLFQSIRYDLYMPFTFILQVNVKLSLCFIKSHVMNDVWGSGDIAPPFLTLIWDGGDWRDSLLDRIVQNIH